MPEPTSTNYANVNDVITLWRPLTASEQTLAAQLLTIVSAEIREKARQYKRDFDEMLENDDDLAVIAKSVCVDVVKRYMCDIGNESPSMSQMSQAAGGYTLSGTFLVAGGGLFLKKSELDRLGLRRQRYGVINLCGD